MLNIIKEFKATIFEAKRYYDGVATRISYEISELEYRLKQLQKEYDFAHDNAEIS